MGSDIRDTKTEMLLRLALAEQLEQDPEVLAFLPESEQKDKHVFSPAHEKKMKKISRMARRVEHRPLRRRRMVHAAAGIVVFLGVSTVTISSVDALRIPVLSFFADVKEKATQYQITTRSESVLTKAFEGHEPGVVLDGFDVESVDEMKDFYIILYTNGSNGLWYEIRFSSKQATLSFDTEDAQTWETQINGNKTIIVNKDDRLRATMYMDTAHVLLTGTISWDAAEKVLESIK